MRHAIVSFHNNLSSGIHQQPSEAERGILTRKKMLREKKNIIVSREMSRRILDKFSSSFNKLPYRHDAPIHVEFSTLTFINQRLYCFVDGIPAFQRSVTFLRLVCQIFSDSRWRQLTPLRITHTTNNHGNSLPGKLCLHLIHYKTVSWFTNV